MESTRRGPAVVSLVAVVGLAGIIVLALLADSPPVAVALIATVPLFAAIFLGLVGTLSVAVLSVAVGLVIPWLRSDGDYSSYLVPLAGVGVATVVALVSASVRQRQGLKPAQGGADEGAEALASADADPMTGLLNRAAAVRALGGRNVGEERVVAFVDCDEFHRVNDDHGREVGDEFLQAVAGRLRHALPTRDTVARWEADEFLIVASTDASKALPALTRVVGAINSHPIRTSAGSIDATLSAGAATWLPGQALEDVITRAGQALHEAKATGRGKVILSAVPSTDATASAATDGA